MPKLSTASKTPISSSNRKSVFLREWWLIEVERDSKLGIGGFVNRETLGSRGMRLLGSASVGKRYNLNAPENGIQVFASAAIAKRLDNNTLEAVDGITITISGCINRSRTLSYGFSAEVTFFIVHTRFCFKDSNSSSLNFGTGALNSRSIRLYDIHPGIK
ncbi:protein EMBRYO DEFECTIVE 1674 isoform X4 [Cynara cardunculus var. scolymus]|uniref:protein EMBRYO DEFECTIVE 1674 isoform X4 n=1 Tax=Cynara cardunculus var. scolymus TaxID=59895 RepID=UPI000D62609A|nr:protein EMBRYO DEFECTIVE 1674 isoform X4 [Cynara cardunculus var. scolymus]